MELNKQIKVICFDYDGTLVPVYKQMKEDTKETLKKLHENGYILALVSGRPSLSARSVLERSVDPSIFKYFFGMNGPDLLNTKTMKQEFSVCFDKEKIKELYEYFKDLDYVSFGFYKDMHLVVDKICDEELINGLAGERNMTSLLYDFEHIDFGFPKVFCVHTVDNKDRIDEYIKNNIHDDSVEYFRSVPHCLEFMPKGVGKDLAIKTICQKEGISKENVLAFGDADNDYPLINSCIGVAMGNGTDKVKNAAKYICDDVEEGGITTFLKEKGFIS